MSVPIAKSRAKRTQVFFSEHCADCALKPQYTTRAKGRIAEINPSEELLAAARTAQWTEGFRERYRERASAERKNAQLKFHTEKIP